MIKMLKKRERGRERNSGILEMDYECKIDLLMVRQHRRVSQHGLIVDDGIEWIPRGHES